MSLPPVKLLRSSGQERATFGAICTFENAEGLRLVLHRKGTPSAAVADMCDTALSLDETFRLLCYSTPSTIYTDMQGMRSPAGESAGRRAATTWASPEAKALSTIGRLELLHPSLMRSTDQVVNGKRVHKGH